MTWRAVPLLGFVVFVGVGFGWRTWWQIRHHGSTGLVLFRSERRSQNVRDALFLVLLVVLAAEAALAAVAPGVISRSGTFLPAGTWPGPLGATLVFGATALMVVAQLDLGASWRIGIEEGARPGLVTVGFYRFCRNPIFLFMELALAGFTLLVPTWVSLGLFAATVVGIRQRVREEEAYLIRSYGEAYLRYARRVGRFVPWVGQLR